MTIEEKLELLPELLALVNNSDAVHPGGQPGCEIEEILETETEVKVDFGISSG